MRPGRQDMNNLLARLALSLGLACSLIAASVKARAAGEDAEQLYAQGRELRKQGRSREALEVFRRVWQVEHSARARGQIGLAEQVLGELVAAEVDLAAALQRSSDSWVMEQRNLLESELAKVRARLGSIAVTGSPRGAQVSIDGHPVGALPLSPIRVMGDSTILIEVQAPGYLPYAHRASVIADDVTRVAVELVPAPEDTGRNRRVALRTSAWIVGGAAAAGVVAGVVSLVVRELAARDFNSHGCRDQSTDPSCTDMKDTFNQAQSGAITSFIIAGALATTSLVLFLSARSNSGQRSATLRIGPGPGDVGLGCAIEF